MDRDFVQTVEGGDQTEVATKKEEKFAEGDEKLTQVTRELVEEDSKDEGIGSFEVVTVTAESLPAASGDHDNKSDQTESAAKVGNEAAVEKDKEGSRSRKRKAGSRGSQESTEGEESDSDSEESYTSEEETETDDSESSNSSGSERVRKKRKQDGDSKVIAQEDDNDDTFVSIDSPALQTEDNKNAAVTTDDKTSTLRRRKRKSREEVKDEDENKEESRPPQRQAQLEEETNLPVIIVTVTCCVALVLYCVCSYYMDRAASTNKIGGRTALHTAAIKGDVTKLMRLLAPNDIDINKQDNMGDTALMLAVRYKMEDAAILLLSEGANHWLFNLNGVAAIHEAATNGLHALIPNLREYGADPELQTYDGWTPLMLAVKADQLMTVRALLEKGHANPNTVSDSGGLTPLHLAAQKSPSYVSVLAKAGGNVNAKDDIFGLTPLHVAASECNVQTARELLKRGADDYLEAKDGTRPRHIIGKKVHRKGRTQKNMQCEGVKRLLMG
ncbi:receptor-interacting serine/threonine-protein kinase 4-like [Branchiostoma floridae]|uniref:Receptor-interacting serine/threonine-protein kinase 4-like n=1 Tax=Branchiostoma floridae TaxID=7739 RepID=A0A9J7HP61_BRAFL|nr:receptor-interacting serine/threonine-protein kinase 4-like [Branchiostoma floridae]